MEKFKHIMIDIETMGNKSFASIVSIAAVRFNLDTGELGEEIHIKVDLQSCLDIGLEVTASTIIWWMERKKKARKEITSGKRINIHNALLELQNFIDENDILWGNSARFDLGILRNAYDLTNKTLPWEFWNERDVRTLVSFNPEIKNNYKFTGTKHNPIDDCKFQIGYCSEIWNSLKPINLE